jgi:hypothetical protein
MVNNSTNINKTKELPHFCACPKPGAGFPSFTYVILFFMFNDLMEQVFICFVDIGGIVFHQYQQNKRKCKQ